MGMAAGRPLFRRISSLRDLFPPPPSPAPHRRLSPLPPSETASSAPAAAATARAPCRRRSTPGSLSPAALEEPGGAFPNEMGQRCPCRSAPNRQIPCSGQNNHNQMRFNSGRVNRYFDVLWNTLDQRYINVSLNEMQNALHMRCMSIHTGQQLNVMDHEAIVAPQCSGDIPSSGNGSELKQKRKKLKGKRAVVRWLKFFRWKKKKEYERMTAEEKILYKLRKARKKEIRLVEALKKIEPSDSSETTHDPEILTPEEHFYFLKMGHKCKNYVPIGRRGIFQGVILNMHLHWKKHQTLKVVVKTFTPEEVQEIAAELARLSGGIVLDIHEENTIIMYRGKNYMQPPTEIMSPKISLSRKKALDKSKYRDALRAVRKFIPRLEQDLELLQVQAKDRRECKTPIATEEATPESGTNQEVFGLQLENLLHSGEKESGNVNHSEDDTSTDSEIISESEALSDIFDTDSDGELDEKVEQPLYLDKFERFPSKVDGKPLDFEEHLRQISVASESCDSSGKGIELSELDEIDRLFLQAGSLLKKRRR